MVKVHISIYFRLQIQLGILIIFGYLFRDMDKSDSHAEQSSAHTFKVSVKYRLEFLIEIKGTKSFFLKPFKNYYLPERSLLRIKPVKDTLYLHIYLSYLVQISVVFPHFEEYFIFPL